MKVLEQELCPKCGKAVYDAEGFPAGGRRYHKRCFKCSSCNKKLSPTTVLCHKDGLYCRACIVKVEPKESPKIFTDTSVIKPQDGKGCPRCDGAVFEAEKLTVKDEVYHKKCFTCAKCSRYIDSLIVNVGPDQDLYCGICYKKETAPERPQVITDTTVIPGSGDTDLKDTCPVCGGKVFEAEKMTGKLGIYHKQCFKCSKCRRPLDYGSLAEAENQLFCKNCYAIEHGHKSKPNLHDADVTVLQGEEGDQDVCPRCNGKVFEAEKMVAKSGSYHKKCFTCAECKHQLDNTNFANGPDDIYCLYCYEIFHGKKAKTKSMPLDTTSITGDGALGTCPRCFGKVFAAEKMVAASGYYHRHCFRCVLCSQPLDSTSVCDGPDNKIYCRICYKRLRGSSKPKFFDEANVATHTIGAKDGEKTCPRCAGVVFPAEKMSSQHNNYHKKCFTCRDCNRPLDPFLACDTPDMEIVCRNCYSKSYSVTSEWCTMSGGDALKLLSTTTIMAEETDNESRCPRCNGKVFHNERVLTSGGRVYHKKCSTCATCEKNIGTKDIYCGKDQDIYCKSCYARKFGAPGYRGAGAGDWTDAQSAETLRPTSVTDTSKLKGEAGDPNTCRRCGGTTFEMERKVSKSSAWHTKCFSCKKCNKPFLSVHYVYEAEDGEIYCKTCFSKSFPESETPLVYSDTTKISSESEETACPRCGGAVFSAEQIEIKGRLYHKKCLSCGKCSRPISIDLLAIGPDGDIYCNICCKSLNWPGQYEVPWDTSIIQGEDGDRETCCRCNGKVFEAEKMIAKRGLYHKRCFTCLKCKTQLDYFNCIEGPDDEIYCKVCYKKFHGPGGKNNFGEKCQTETEDGDEDACVRCRGKVFEVERIQAKAGPYHKYCLSCNECGNMLDSSTFYNGEDGEVYCKHCYANKFGHKAKSEYKGWMDHTTIMGEAGEAGSCPRCNGKVFEAEKCPTKVGPFHKNCFSCIECSKKLDSVTCCEGPDGEIYCKACYASYFGSRSRSRSRAKILGGRAKNLSKFYNNEDDMLARSTVETWVIKAEKDSQDCCPKCGGKVYEAEKMVAANGKWYHKNCYRCVVCNNMLDSLNNNDGSDGNIYCRMCYRDKYGPQNRSSDIDLKARNTSSMKAEDPSRNCPRCGGVVFANEEITSKGKSYHKRCATCADCDSPLTYNTLYSGDGEIYCKLCYGRKFAPLGYRGAGCSSWVDTESNNVLRHSFQEF